MMTPKTITTGELLALTASNPVPGIRDLQVQRYDFAARKWQTLPDDLPLAVEARVTAYERAGCDLTGYVQYDRVFIGDVPMLDGTGVHRVLVDVR